MNEQPIIESLEAFLDQEEIPYDLVEDHIIRIALEGKNCNADVLVYVDEEFRDVFVHTYGESKVPKDRIPAVAEYILRVNQSNADIGCFELDYDKGTISYRTELVSLGERISDRQIEAVIFSNFYSFDRYYPGVLQLAWSARPGKPKSVLESVKTIPYDESIFGISEKEKN